MDDDYVAQVLAKEARESSQKYSSNGLSAFMPSKPTSNAPKPNTRFLRHLIKETDSHNTALKRKEEKEARERMRTLKKQSAAANESTSHSHRRPDRASTRGTEGPRLARADQHRSHGRRNPSRSTSTERDRSRRHRHRDEKDRDRTRDGRHDRPERRGYRRADSSLTRRRDRERSYSRSRSRSPRRERERDRDRASKSRRSERSRRSESPSHTHSSHSQRKSRESERRSRRDEHTSSRQHRLTPPKSDEPRESKSSSTTTTQRRDVSEDSDPLEELVGPLHPSTANSEAPIRSRGRGAYRSNTSNIDAHFASDYDPTLDIQPDEVEGNNTKQPSRRHVTGLMTGEDDWEMALEAMRDRTKWKQKGEERLRAAGINEGAIDRWKKEPAFTGLDGERRPEDVRWSKSGEGREWDRGKFVDDEGHIDVRAAWPKSN